MPKSVEFAPEDDPLKETNSTSYEEANDLIAERLRNKIPGFKGQLVRRRRSQGTPNLPKPQIDKVPDDKMGN